jgi:hypothetical protein
LLVSYNSNENFSFPISSTAFAIFVAKRQKVEHNKKENVTFLKMITVPSWMPSWRRRSPTAMFLLYATQCTGILAIGNDQLLLYNSLGLKDWAPPLFVAHLSEDGHRVIEAKKVDVTLVQNKTGSETGAA